MFFGDFKKLPASLPGNSLKNFFAVRPLFARVSATAMAPHAATITSAPAKTAAIVFMLIVLEQNRIHNRVGFLRALNGRFQAELAASVHAIRKNDQCLAALLFFHQLVGSQIR